MEPAFALPERYAVDLRWIPFVLRINGPGQRSIYPVWKARYSYMDASKELETRRHVLEEQRAALMAQRQELAQRNRLRERIEGFAQEVMATVDRLNFDLAPDPV